MLSAIEKLLAIEEIKIPKARYLRYLDAHDWENFRKLFTDDAVFSPPRPPQENTAEVLFARSDDFHGADAFLEWVTKMVGEGRTTRMGFMPEIEVISMDEATGIWAAEDVIRWAGRTSHGFGYYRESYVRRDGEWLINKWALFYKSIELHELSTTGGAII